MKIIDLRCNIQSDFCACGTWTLGNHIQETIEGLQACKNKTNNFFCYTGLETGYKPELFTTRLDLKLVDSFKYSLIEHILLTST